MLRGVGLLLLWAALFGAGWMLNRYAIHYSEQELQVIGVTVATGMIAWVFVLYVVTAALPFVPGAEIGLALLVTFGARFALLVYLSMILALGLAFAVGRIVPARHLCRGFRAMKMHAAARMIEEVADRPKMERSQYLMQNLPKGLAGFFLRHRYIALAVVLNLPGNSIIGGGGGISLVAGMSKLFSPTKYALSIALAVAPIP